MQFVPVLRSRILSPVARLARGCALAALAAAPALAGAQPFTDPVDDFRAAFPDALQQPHLDITGGAVYFDGSRFTLTGTLAGDIPTDAPANLAYVYGVNRGTGAARFGGLGLGGILFDAAIVLRPNGPDVLNLFTSATPITPAIGSVTFSGNTFTAVIDAAALPSPNGTPFEAYTFNLWPRLIGSSGITDPARGLEAANLEIPDFGPDNRNIGVSTIPEPATLLLVGPALGGLMVLRRRRRSA